MGQRLPTLPRGSFISLLMIRSLFLRIAWEVFRLFAVGIGFGDGTVHVSQLVWLGLLVGWEFTDAVYGAIHMSLESQMTKSQEFVGSLKQVG